MIRRPPRSTRTDTLFPSRRSSDLRVQPNEAFKDLFAIFGRNAGPVVLNPDRGGSLIDNHADLPARRSEEHTSELQSLMRISYAVFCLKKKKNHKKRRKNKIENIN